MPGPPWPGRTWSGPALALAACAALAAAVWLAACGPAEGTPEAVYRKQCARCHGLDGRGNPRAVDTKPGLDLRDSPLVADLDRPEIRRRIVEGEGTMPAFGDKLTADEIDAMVEMSIRLGGGPSR